MAALINGDDSPSCQPREDGTPVVLLLGQAVQQHKRQAGSLAIVMVREGCLGAVGQGYSHCANAIATIITGR